MPLNAYLMDRLLTFEWRQFYSDSLAHARLSREPLVRFWSRLFGDAAFPRLKRWLDTRSDRLDWRRRRHLSRGASQAATFGLRPEFLDGMSFVPWPTNRYLHLPRSARGVVEGIHAFARGSILASSHEPLSVCTAHPFAHRPLINFLIAAPPSAIGQVTGSRLFIRAALRHVLPEQILNRCSKGNAQPASARRLVDVVLAAIDQGELRHWSIIKRGIVDSDQALSIFSTFLDGSEQTTLLVNRLLFCEMTLRRIDTGSATHQNSLVLLDSN